MFTPFQMEVLSQKPFIKNEVQFNLFHKMLEATLDVAVMSDDKKMIALYGTGRSMWLWIYENQRKETIENITVELSSYLKDTKLYGIAGEPFISRTFAQKYSELLGISFELTMGMESYHCPIVRHPRNVPGKIISAEVSHIETIAEFCAGFHGDSYGTRVSTESQIPTAERLVDTGNLYLWTVNDMVVSMANIAHRSPRQARINSVYTSPEKRKNGYASALVADLCDQILNEGLIPILFADVKNSDSNKVYKNIGFIESGKISDYVFNY